MIVSGTHNHNVYKVCVCVCCMEQSISQTIHRKKRIDCVENSLRKAMNSKREIDYKKLIILVCEQFVCSDRMAKEYITIAKSRIKEL